MPKITKKHTAFTPAEDDLIVDLKEVRRLTWREIAAHFPGRTQGSLQVHYCRDVQFRNNPRAKAQRRGRSSAPADAESATEEPVATAEPVASAAAEAPAAAPANARQLRPRGAKRAVAAGRAGPASGEYIITHVIHD